MPILNHIAFFTLFSSYFSPHRHSLFRTTGIARGFRFHKNNSRTACPAVQFTLCNSPIKDVKKFFLTGGRFCAKLLKYLRPEATHAGVAELADARDLKSRGSDPVPVRPRSPAPYRGVEQLVARRAHNPEVVSSSLAPATIQKKVETSNLYLLFCDFVLYIVFLLLIITIYSVI